MRVLPSSVLDLSQLEYLDISRMQLSSLPVEPKFQTLTTLNVSHNRLKKIDKAWLELSSLEELNLMNNALDEFSDWEVWMPALRVLDLS